MLIIWGKLKEKNRATTNGCDFHILRRGTSHGACGGRHQLHCLAPASSNMDKEAVWTKLSQRDTTCYMQP